MAQLTSLRLAGWKSIRDAKIELRPLNVLIGANGSGKSNIVEAIALASAAAHYKLDNEFLISRGIRVTETRFMRSAFAETPTHRDGIRISVQRDDGIVFDWELLADQAVS